MSGLRIFSYLPNPRLWKATIAARLNGVAIEVRGAAPGDLKHWLWDFDARPLTAAEQGAGSEVQIGTTGFSGARLHKSAAFLAAHPFGTVPAAFSADGVTGIFESNSILRAVGRLGAGTVNLYGDDAYAASRIDSFLDASLVFGRDTQPYLLSLLTQELSAATHTIAAQACATYLGGIERALGAAGDYLVGDRISLADICFACELTMLWYERPHYATLAERGWAPAVPPDLTAAYPRAGAHFRRLRHHRAFALDLEPHLLKLERGDSALAL